ncbi:MAG TPA: hypothetical protein VGP24_13545 [Glaciihabitans sp.]|nr:hypothetical protein [Glaciihabitans sp.]
MEASAPLRILGAPGVVCEGDVCEVPAQSEQALVKELLDSGEI